MMQHDLYESLGYSVTRINRQRFLLHIMHRFSALFSSADYQFFAYTGKACHLDLVYLYALEQLRQFDLQLQHLMTRVDIRTYGAIAGILDKVN